MVLVSCKVWIDEKKTNLLKTKGSGRHASLYCWEGDATEGDIIFRLEGFWNRLIHHSDLSLL